MKISNEILLPIEEAVYTGKVNLMAFLKSCGDDRFCEYAVQHPVLFRNVSTISFIKIQDIYLRRRLMEFLKNSIDEKRILPSTFFVYRLKALKSIIDNLFADKTYSYVDFVNMDIKKLECIPKQFNAVSFKNEFWKFCQSRDYLEHYQEGDVIDLKYYNLSFDRNFSKQHRYIYLTGIDNEINRNLVKKYFDYCLTNTGVAVSTLLGRLSVFRKVFNLIEIPFCNWDEEVADKLMNDLSLIYSSYSTLVNRYLTLNSFSEYLLMHDYIEKNYFTKYKFIFQGARYNYKVNSVDNYVLAQIFNNLDNLKDDMVMLIFLLIYTVGMRLAEALNLKRDCLEKTGQGYFIRYYSCKMKKDVTNVIPKALYLRLENFRTTKTYCDYMFSRKLSKPVQSSFFYDKIKEFIRDNNICDINGKLYHFKAHSFRHLMAVRMREHNIPSQFVQEQLHHNNISMTMAYLEVVDHSILKKMQHFVDKNGIDNSCKAPNEEEYKIEYLRNHIHAQILPNGICARPIKLGICPHNNVCLTCPEYRTSKKNLHAHREHLERVNRYIRVAEEQGWAPQVESNKIIKKNLEKIIERLEKINE